MKKAFKNVKSYFFTFCTLIYTGILVFAPTSAAFASTSDDAWKKAGITKSGSVKTSGIYTELGNVVWFIMAIGGIWVLAWIIVGGMLLAGSNGNPQKRTAGIASLGTSLAGGWVIYKAYDIAGYIAGFGAS